MAYIIKQPLRGKIYVNLVENRHIPKVGPRQKRKYLGTLDPASGQLVLGKNTPDPTPSIVRLLKKANVPFHGTRRKSKSGPTHGLPISGNGMVSDRCLHSSRPVERLGEVHLLGHLSEAVGLSSVLEKSFGPIAGKALLMLAMYQVCEARPLYLAEDWLESVRLEPELDKYDFSSPALSVLMAQLGADHRSREQFMRNWIQACGSPQAILYDMTSMSTYSTELELAEWGYNRDNDQLPQVNLAVVTSADNRLPLAFRLLQGSIPDVSTLKSTGDFLLAHGMRKFSYSLDRGFYSQANVRDLLNSGLGFTIGAPLSVNKTRQLIRRHRSALSSCKRSFRFKSGVIRHVHDDWTVNMGDEGERKIVAHVYYDPRCAVRRVTELEDRIFSLEEKAGQETLATKRDAYQWLKENARWLAKCFRVRRNGDQQQIVRKPHAVACMANRLGYTVVLTDATESTGEKTLAIYRSRDSIEKMIHVLKNENEQGRFRTGDTDRVEGRMFLSYLSLILHAAIERRMEEAGLFKSTTIPKLLAEMRKIKVIRYASGTRIQTEISKKQRTMLKRLRIPIPTIL